MKKAVWIALVAGLPAGLTCLALAFLMTGAGHGWITPFWFSLGAPLAFPLAIWAVLSPKRPNSAPVYGLLLILALASDAQLYAMTDAEGWQYFHRVAPFNFIWLAIWSLWQLALLFALATALRKRPA